MDIANTSPQAMNILFTFLSQLQNTVVWVCTADYKKQLFLSDGFSNIWGIPKEQLYEDLGLWMKTLYHDDVPLINQALKKRAKTQQGCNVVNFRIQRPDNQVRCLKSTTYTMLNQEGKPAAVLGVDENLPVEQWQHTKDLAVPVFPLIKDLSDILAKELKLLAPSTTQPVILTDVMAFPKTITINNKTIPLTERESQCLVYLIQGRSAKETAYYLKISTRTVETYLDKIRYKANCRTKIALIGMLQQTQTESYW